MRLIDADALENRLYESQDNNTVKNVMYKMIRTAPTIDAVPVVRCRECLRAEPYYPDTEIFICELLGTVLSNDYCSYGRKEET